MGSTEVVPLSKQAKSQSEPKRRSAGRPPKLGPDQVEQLVQITREHPSFAYDDIIILFRKRTGTSLCRQTVAKYLRQAGVERVVAGVHDETVVSERADDAQLGRPHASGAPKRYGYNDSHRDPGDGSRYPCGLTDPEWDQVRDLFEKTGPGRPPKYERRHMLDACIYVLRSGCSWRMLPKDFPPWGQVYSAFRRWSSQGLFEQMYDRLRVLWRQREHRAPEPTAAIIDSQSVKTSPQGGPKGYDGGKKIKGRKRHLVTDTLGLLLAVLITTANVQDRDAALPAVEISMGKHPTIRKLYADGGYAGKKSREVGTKFDIDVEIVRHPANRNVGTWQHPDQLSLFGGIPAKRGFVVLPKRWIVERNNAWNERPRRMNRDHDRRFDVAESWIWLTEARMLLRRLVSAC